MPLSGSYPSLINGVSQQPPHLRLTTQAEAQENAYSSVTDGLGKRPPTEYVGKIASSVPSDAFTHIINRDDTEKYVVYFDGTLRVSNLLTGASVPLVASSSSLAYLASANPSKDLRGLTIADRTVLLNRSKTVAMASTKTPVLRNEATIWVKQGNYSSTYSLFVNGSNANYTTPDGTNVGDEFLIRAENIVLQLQNSLRVFLSSAAWPFLWWGGSIFGLRPASGASFTIEAQDSQGNSLLSVTSGKVAGFTKLPPSAINGQRVLISGDSGSDYDDYWVQFVGDIPGDRVSPGIWEECAAPDTLTSLDAATMPQSLTRKQDTTGAITGVVGGVYFELEPIAWNTREVGDDDSNKQPSFVGYTLNDVFLHKNRLGFLSRSNIIMSESGNLFNFWRTTIRTVLDGDRIDITVTHPRALNLQSATPYNQSLLVMGDSIQAILSNSDVLSQKTSSVNFATEFDSEPFVRPVTAERAAYFPFSRGTYAGLREYTTSVVSENVQIGEDITAAIPEYIAGSILGLQACSTEPVMVLTSRNDRTRLWAFKWFTANQQRLQTSWSVFSLGSSATILGSGWIGATLYLFVGRPGGVFIEKMVFDFGREEDGRTWIVHLDQKIASSACSPVYDALSNKTIYTLPYEVPATLVTILRSDATYVAKDTTATVTASQIAFSGDTTGTPMWFGVPYSMRYTFSTPYVRSGQDQKALTEGRLQILRYDIKYHNAQIFKVEVASSGRDTETYEFGRSVGFYIPDQSETDGEAQVPVFGKNEDTSITIVNDTIFPAWFISAQWLGNFNSRVRPT